MLRKMVITQIAQGWQNGTRLILSPDYTLNHNQKEINKYIPQIHVHLELVQTIIAYFVINGSVLGPTVDEMFMR